MSLSTLSIQKVLEEITRDYIHRSNYASLYNSCIDLKPIDAITTPITKQLRELLDSEKTNIATQLTEEACKKQRDEDLKEQKRNQQESNKYAKTAQTLEEELRRIQSEQQKNEQEIENLCTVISHQQNPTSHTHAHPIPTAHPIQTHPSTQEHQSHNHPTVTTGQQVQKSASYLIDLQKNLSIKEALREELKTQQQKITQQLSEELEKEKIRQEHMRACNMRSHAYSESQSIEYQLSLENYYSLCHSIKKKQAQLEVLHNKLVQQTRELGYPIFLTQLKQHLKPLTTLSYSEKRALIQACDTMQRYCSTMKEIQTLELLYCTAQNEKKALTQNLTDQKNRLTQITENNPKLYTQIQRLNKENQALEKRTQNQRPRRNNFFIKGLWGLLGTALAAISGGLLGVYLIPSTLIISLCFAPAVVAGCVTIGFFIAACSYALKIYKDVKQIEQHKQSILQIEQTIYKESEEFNSLNQTVIPSLQTQLKNADKKCMDLSNSLKSHQEDAKSLHQKAKNITVSTHGTQPTRFLNSEPLSPITHSSTEPSAPQDEELIASPTTLTSKI